MRRWMVLVLALLVSCGGNATPGATSSATSSSAPSVGNTKAGRAHLEFSGSYNASVDMALDNNRSQLHAPPGGFAVFWASHGNLLSMGGVSVNGSHKTSSELVVGFLWIKGNVVVSKTSSKGECTITMHSTPQSIEGSFDCPKLIANRKPYAAKGTFSAST